MKPRIVLDSNIVVSALRSQLGASFRLLSLVGQDRFDICVSVPLIHEHEASAKRAAREVGLRAGDIEIVVDYLCRVAVRQEIHFLWHPQLRDADDDMVLEAAVASGAEYIVTFNRRDFAGSERFGIKAVTPQDFLRRLGEMP